MAVARRRLGVVRGVEPAGPVTPRAAHAVRGLAEAGDQLTAASAGGAGTGIMLHAAAETRPRVRAYAKSPAVRPRIVASLRASRSSGRRDGRSAASGASSVAPRGR